MAKVGNRFNITDKRLALVKDLIRKQYSLTYAADKLGIAKTTLSEKLIEMKIDLKALKREGINTFKADMFAEVMSVEEPDKKAKLMLDVLKHYDKSDDVADVKIEVKSGVSELYKAMNGN